MGDNHYWFNRVGKVAPVSNPGSATPNYGLTYDLSTAPYDQPDQFDDLAAALTSYAGSISVGASATGTGTAHATAPDPTLWDNAKGAAGFVGDQVAGGLGALDYAILKADEHMPEWSQLESTKSGEAANTIAGIHDFGDLQDLGKERLGSTAKEISASPGAHQIFWGLEKANEYASTAFVAATLSEDDTGKFFKAGTWGDAHALTKERRLTAGEAFAQMFYQKEVLLDDKRFEDIRTHNTVFNVGALAFNVVAAWKTDPNVLLGKGVGEARSLATGRLATSGRTAEVQRDVLGAKTLDEAKAKVGAYETLPDKLRAMHAVSLYDRSLALREAARTQDFAVFAKNPAFSPATSASGVTMAKLMQDVANDDEAWNLVFRSAIGDPDAVGQLIARQGEVSDKIAAIELKTMPNLQRDLARTEERYKKRLAEQGRPQDARIELTRFGDKWLDDELTLLRAEAEAQAAHLDTYATHESWLQRAMTGLDEDTGTLNGASPNTIFDTLDRLGSRRSSLRDMGGKVDVWQHDLYSPVSWLLKAPSKPFLKRVGVVSLNDVEDGAGALTHYIDQLEYVTGKNHFDVRNHGLEQFAGSTTDMERKAVVDWVERHAIRELGKKYGLSTDIMDQLGRHLAENRQQSWAKFSDNSIYSPIPGKNGPGYVSFTDDAGNLQRIKMPVDPTQLPNYHPLTNITDLDRTIRHNLDTLRDFDADLATSFQAGRSAVLRHATDFQNYVGHAFNGFWKPLALISLRWPMRVVADESMRVMAMVGILPHLAQWGRGAGNVLWNNGVVRPFEYWGGRRVKTGSLSEESLRSTEIGYDAYDYRALTNPNAAVPVESLDFGKIDSKRYNRLNLTTNERWQYLRTQEFSRRQTAKAKSESGDRMAGAVEAFTKPERPTWATAWDKRLAEAQASDARGFFFDPLHPHKGISKGFAVSPYPTRMRTFEVKPSAREMNYWVEKNSDVLSIPSTRAAVWLDKDTGRWHLDAVKVVNRREDAMLLAAKAEAPEFYDIGDGFTRYMSEDFWGHFHSPFVKPKPEPNPPAGVGADQLPLRAAADDIGSRIGAAVKTGGPERQKIGFGAKTWRSRDGKKITGEKVFGPDTKNANIYYSVVSSRGAIQNLYGGYTKGIGIDRASRSMTDYRHFDPAENPDHWAVAYTDFVNNHIRMSPIGQRMLEGKSDEEIYNWLVGTAKGRAARKRVAIRGENPHQWVSDSREIFDHIFPTEKALLAAREGDLTPEQALKVLGENDRMTVHGDNLKLGLGTSDMLKGYGKVVDWLMTHLGSLPTDALARHPFAASVYDREMRNYLSSVPADKITNNVLKAAEASARAKAVRDVRRTLYHIADEREAVHMLRFVAPFFQAQLEVLERWAQISMEHPESIAHLAQLFIGSQTLPNPFWKVTDQEGKPATGYSPDNVVHFQVTDTMRQVAKKLMPGDPLKYADELVLNSNSMNLITMGETPYLPSLGPLVTVPASEFYYKDRPELEDSMVYKWMFPMGVPSGKTAFGRLGDAIMPAWMKRVKAGETADFNDSAFARRVSEIGAQQILEWEMGGRKGPKPTGEQALTAAKNEYRLRAASSFFLPVPLTPRSPYQFWIDQYRMYKQKYGLQADEKFYDDMGPTYFMFAQQATEGVGMGPDVGEKKAYDKYKPLADRAPDLIGVLTGPFATDQFSDAVYQWQLDTRRSPTSSKMLREHIDPDQRIADMEVARGWVEYTKLSSALDAELRSRVAAGGSAYLTASSNADLAAIKAEKWREIVTRNPAWQDAYNSRTAHLGSWLGQAYDVAFDPKLDDRPDIQGLRAYLIGRARLQDALRQREDSGMSSSDQLSFDPVGRPVGDNADLAAAWMSWVNELKGRNPLFSEIYTRYLEGDDLSVYIPPEVSGG